MSTELPPLETDDERRERHLRMLRRLGELCMEVAEGAGAQALAEQKRAAEEGNAALPPEGGAVAVGWTAARVLARMASVVRMVVALETRIVRGTAGEAARAKRVLIDDPRMRFISEGFERLVEADARRTKVEKSRLRREVDAALHSETMAEAMAADPESGLVHDVVDEICETLDVPFDIKHLSDQFMLICLGEDWTKPLDEICVGPEWELEAINAEAAHAEAIHAKAIGPPG